jgi:two-component system NtrC family sensor kinase
MPPEDPHFGLTGAAFADAFPFHLVLDRELEVVQSGPVIQRLCPGLVAGGAFSAHFQLRRPAIEANWDAFVAQPHSLFLLEGNRPGLLLRGMMVALDDGAHLAFLGSPWLTSVRELETLGLSLHEFAVHDPIADLLFLIQTKDHGLDDAKALAAELRTAKEAAEAKLREFAGKSVESGKDEVSRG